MSDREQMTSEIRGEDPRRAQNMFAKEKSSDNLHETCIAELQTLNFELNSVCEESECNHPEDIFLIFLNAMPVAQSCNTIWPLVCLPYSGKA